ncbi:MAG: hypothetical protein Q4B15_05140 [Lachnospiraceae bacterium]|nr:hypothetical protein [Lachnospiraceae bacterium]
METILIAAAIVIILALIIYANRVKRRPRDEEFYQEDTKLNALKGIGRTFLIGFWPFLLPILIILILLLISELV